MRNATMLLFLACSTALSTFAAHPPSPSPVSLKVTVNPTQLFSTPGTPTDVSADGSRPYIDGQDGVCASITSGGYLSIDFDCASASTPRWLGFALGTDSSVGCTPTPPSVISPSASADDSNIVSRPATDQNSAAFQSMAIYNGDATTIYYIQLVINAVFSGNLPSYRLNYHWTGTFPDATLSSYAQVRRLSSTRWVVESASIPNANLAMLVSTSITRHQSVTTECGLYTEPFSFTLDQQ